MNLKIQTLDKKYTPVRMSDGAACFDLFARTSEYNREFGYLSVLLGVKMEIPDGYVVDLIPRSSVSKKGITMANSFGIIDPDFRGELEARFYPAMTPEFVRAIMKGEPNLETYMNGKFKEGEAAAQFRIISNLTQDVVLEEVEEMSTTNRGEKGFGSTTK